MTLTCQFSYFEELDLDFCEVFTHNKLLFHITLFHKTPSFAAANDTILKESFMQAFNQRSKTVGTCIRFSTL